MGPCFRPTWTISAPRGMGPPHTPACPRALSDTSPWAWREASTSPSTRGAAVQPHPPCKGHNSRRPGALVLGQHNKHSGSCGLLAPPVPRGRMPGGLWATCSPPCAHASVRCPSGTVREEGRRSPSSSPGHSVRAGAWPSDSWCTSSPRCVPLKQTEALGSERFHGPCRVRALRPGEKTQSRSEWGGGQRQPCPGSWQSLGVLPLQEAFGKKGAKARRRSPQPLARWFPRLLAPTHGPTSL